MDDIQDAIVVSPSTERSIVENSRSAASVISMKHTVDKIKRTVMKKEVHFGIIPGTDKPVLFQAGADCLALTFKLEFTFHNEDLGDGLTESRYRSRCVVSHGGEFLGDCEGTCSSHEEKYKWRYCVSDAQWEATPEDMRRIKYYKNKTVKQIRTEPADVDNTILKMAQKRAKLGAVKNVLAISDIFDVDIDDYPEDLRADLIEGGGKAPSEPKRKKKAPAKKKAKEEKPPEPAPVSEKSDPDEAAEELEGGGGEEMYTGKITKVEKLKETDQWTMWMVAVNDFEMVTFDERLQSMAVSAQGFDSTVAFDYQESDKGKRPKLTALQEIKE